MKRFQSNGIFIYPIGECKYLERQVASQYMYKDSLGLLLHENTKNSY